ncbi:MAG: (2Fe-2S)-binding protein [Proteobacteria bacterium]|nr:(2Fe-2S)-binding protein [Pseudomonadota bacterium]
MIVNVEVNGERQELLTEPYRTLLDLLRDNLSLTGTKEGCGTGDCGACTVLLDGRPVNSCLVLAPEAEGRHVTTVEGLAEDNRLHPIQTAFIEEGGLQCGICTPGMLMSAVWIWCEPTRPALSTRMGYRSTTIGFVITSVNDAREPITKPRPALKET